MAVKNCFIVALLFVQLGFGQQKKADRFFDGADYISAAKIYEGLLQKEKSKYLLEKLSDCYYNTYQYPEAIKTLSDLVNGNFKDNDKYYDNRYNFMYYQFLSANGDYEKAIDYLVIFKNNRGTQPPQREASKEEVEAFRLKMSDYRVEKTNFNSKASDFGAVKLNDTVYFSSDRENASGKKYSWTHRPFLDLYGFKVDENLEPVGEASPMPTNINSELHEGSFCFSKDGKTLYLSRSNLENGKEIFDKDKNNNVQLYVTHKQNGKWQEPIKLPFNSNDYNYEHPALSPDGKRLFYASNELGSVGSYDIYYVDINADDTYGSPKNLSYVINTENREQFPYISEEGHLFFASNGHLGLGMLDIFVSQYVDGKFTKPVNLGSPINSRYDDYSLRYYDTKNGFFASNRDEVNDDIFAFEQTGSIFDKEYITQIEVRDTDTKEYVPNAVVNLIHKGKIVYENILDEVAQFNPNLVAGVYDFTATTFGYDNAQMQFTVTKENNQKQVLYLKRNSDIANITKNQSPASKATVEKLLKDEATPLVFAQDGKLFFDIPPIYFDFDQWEIREDSKKVLADLVTKLKQYPSLQIRINAHTDTRGSELYNQILSEKRAASTRDYITRIGKIASSRVVFKGYGMSKLLEECGEFCSEVQHQKNRRSEFEIVRY